MGEPSGEKSNLPIGEEISQFLIEHARFENLSEPTNSQKTQDLIKRNISSLENLTRSATQLAIFSENEDVSEISTDSLRLLLLPALLGFYTGKLINDEGRLKILQREQVYYRDFLKRLQLYGVIKREDDDEKGDGVASSAQSAANGVAQARNRLAKIEKFKQQKELETKLETLRELVDRGAVVDEDVTRELYLTELKLWAARIAESIETVQQEIEMLRMRENSISSGASSSTAEKNHKKAPLKPFIITRTELQKTIYGMGYPSLPTMSLEEFFEQKQREGQIRALSSGESEGRKGPITEEEEQIMRETQEECEMSEVVQHDREYDEYKDDHRRGWGNTKNKG